MKLQDPILPLGPESGFDRALTQRLYDILRPLILKLNGIGSWSYVHFADNAATAAPTTGTYRQGDIVRNSNPTEAGTALTKYVVLGWICTVSGTPGTWLDMRTLTGN